MRLIQRALARLGQRRCHEARFHLVRHHRTAVEQLHLRLTQRAAIGRVQRFRCNVLRLLDRTERGLAVVLVFAHELVQSARRPRTRIVFECGNAVDQVAALALYISGAEQAVLQIRVIQQIAQQTDHTGGQTVGSRCISLINTVGQKADAQVLALLAHCGFNTRTVQLVKRGAERLHVVQPGRAAAQNLRQTRAQRGILAAERQHQHRTQHCPLKLRCGHAGEIDSRTQRFSGHLLHNFPRFRKSLSNGLYYTVYAGVTQT